jgi:hypothetical protein
VARVVLYAGAALWTFVGAAGIGLALIGTDTVRAVLPPLAISPDALAGTILVLAIGCVALGLVHLAVALGVDRGSSWAVSGGILLAGVAVAVFLALAAAALTAGAAGSLFGQVALLAALAAFLLAGGYALTGAALARRLRSRPPT